MTSSKGTFRDPLWIQEYPWKKSFFRGEDSNSKNKERILLITTKAEKKYTDFNFRSDDTILFGRETAGVPKEVHDLVDAKLKIPMIKNKRSLNLSTSVAIVLAENLRQTNYI